MPSSNHRNKKHAPYKRHPLESLIVNGGTPHGDGGSITNLVASSYTMRRYMGSGPRYKKQCFKNACEFSDGVGYRIYSKVLHFGIVRRLSDHCSEYQAEILAIIEIAEGERYNVMTMIRINISNYSQMD